MTTAPADTFRRTGEEAPLRPAPELPGRLRDLLADKKVVITGVTGFIGEQLLWKMLTELPQTRPSVLVRRKGSASARERVASLLRKPIFADAVPAAGGITELLDERIEVIEGDLPNVPELPADLDVLVHCAGGYRSSIAASLLQRDGFAAVGEIAGGIAAWEAAKLPIETG